jgi:UDPglucose 6-dehydrogenase
MGRRVRCTPDHPFVTLDGVKRADGLGLQDWLPLPIAPVELTERAAASLRVLAGAKPREVIVRLGREQADRLAAMSHATLTRALESLALRRGARVRGYDIKRSLALRLDELTAVGLTLDGAAVGTAKNGTYVPVEVPIDDRFWRVVGLYLSEGHCSSDGRQMRLVWSFHPTREQHLVDEVAGYWRELGVKADVHSTGTAMAVSVSSRLLARTWLTLGLGKDCYEHALPAEIWRSGEPAKRALLSGIWQGDGSWSLLNGGPSVALEYGTASRTLADGVLRLLGDLGIVARQKVGRTAKSTVDTHWLVISGAAQIERVLELIAPRDRPGVSASMARQRKRIAPTGYRIDGRTAWLRVADVRRRPYQGWVYSLEVPGAETVITTGGLVVHNCFPKDVKALQATARDLGLEFDLLRAVERTNERQKKLLVAKATRHFGPDLSGKQLAVWGLSFKPKTDDMREAPSIELIEGLLGKGAKITAHDPVAERSARRVLGERVQYAPTMYDALEGADALFIVTEWNDFRHPDFERMKSLMRSPVIFDGRNVFDPNRMREKGFTYFGIGRPPR